MKTYIFTSLLSLFISSTVFAEPTMSVRKLEIVEMSFDLPLHFSEQNCIQTDTITISCAFKFGDSHSRGEFYNQHFSAEEYYNLDITIGEQQIYFVHRDLGQVPIDFDSFIVEFGDYYKENPVSYKFQYYGPEFEVKGFGTPEFPSLD